jgi:hypothetical protein
MLKASSPVAVPRFSAMSTVIGTFGNGWVRSFSQPNSAVSRANWYPTQGYTPSAVSRQRRGLV